MDHSADDDANKISESVRKMLKEIDLSEDDFKRLIAEGSISEDDLKRLIAEGSIPRENTRQDGHLQTRQNKKIILPPATTNEEDEVEILLVEEDDISLEPSDNIIVSPIQQTSSTPEQQTSSAPNQQTISSTPEQQTSPLQSSDTNYFSFEATIEQLHISAEDLKHLVSEGEIRAFRRDDSIIFRKSDIETFLNPPREPPYMLYDNMPSDDSSAVLTDFDDIFSDDEIQEGQGIESNNSTQTNPSTNRSYYSFEETLRKLRIEEDDLKMIVASGDIRVFRDDDQMKFRRADIDGIIKGRMGEPTIILPSRDEELIDEEPISEEHISHNPKFGQDVAQSHPEKIKIASNKNKSNDASPFVLWLIHILAKIWPQKAQEWKQNLMRK